MHLVPQYSPVIQTPGPAQWWIRAYCYKEKERNQRLVEEAQNQIYGLVETLPYA